MRSSPSAGPLGILWGAVEDRWDDQLYQEREQGLNTITLGAAVDVGGSQAIWQQWRGMSSHVTCSGSSFLKVCFAIPATRSVGI